MKAIACELPKEHGLPLSRFSRAELHRLVVERGISEASASTIARWLAEDALKPWQPIGNVQIEPGDWIVADDDGVVVVPQGVAEDVLAEAEEKAATESEIRVAVRDGMPPLEAYERFGTF